MTNIQNTVRCIAVDIIFKLNTNNSLKTQDLCLCANLKVQELIIVGFCILM